VRVEVSDRYPGTPTMDTAARVDGCRAGGCCSFTLAIAWGVTPNGTGRVVWFEVQQ